MQVDLSVLLYSSPFRHQKELLRCRHFASCFSDLSVQSFERISIRNSLMPLWLARILLSLWRAAKKSSVLAISDWGRNSSDGNNSAQLICFIQGARNSTTLFAAYSLSAAGSEHLNVWQPLLQVQATKSLEPALLSSEQNLPGEAFTVHFHGNRHMPFLLPRRQSLLFETGEHCAQSISASLTS